MAVISHLIGGLGNQLFQYATGKALAERLGEPLLLDLSAFSDYSLRNYELMPYRLNASIASVEDIHVSLPQRYHPHAVCKIYHKVKQRLLPAEERNYQEESLKFSVNRFHNIRRPCYLYGYWQREEYFLSIRDTLRTELQLPDEPDEKQREWMQLMKEEESVSIHVRRGDYVSNPETARVHGSLPEAYYRTAMETISRSFSSPLFFLFSDDPGWVKKQWSLPGKVMVIDEMSQNSPQLDLQLMSLCRHHIIANSTFSWWGAWLAESKDSVIIAPRQWFTPEEMKERHRDPVPERWIRL